MPAGTPNVKSTPVDLEGFLKRKRITLQAWLTNKDITSTEALKTFLIDPYWSMSDSIKEQINDIAEAARPLLEEVKASRQEDIETIQNVDAVETIEVVIDNKIDIINMADEPNDEIVLENVEKTISPKERKKTGNK